MVAVLNKWKFSISLILEAEDLPGPAQQASPRFPAAHLARASEAVRGMRLRRSILIGGASVVFFPACPRSSPPSLSQPGGGIDVDAPTWPGGLPL